LFRAFRPVISFRLRLKNNQNNINAQKICAFAVFLTNFTPGPPSLLKPAALLWARNVSQFGHLLARLRKENTVKLIIAAIKPFKLEDVREALTEIGVRGMMVSEIKGFGAQSGHTEIYRGAEYAVNFVPKIKLEIVVESASADQVVETIMKTAQTGKIGDGKIFVLDVAQTVRVRTGESGPEAI
jgi:nitrogen regulatory protein P-II 1|tara:strand:- start:813 stop:1364 length:552 start_codon:yes stop_codon:yes gene_type:complete